MKQAKAATCILVMLCLVWTISAAPVCRAAHSTGGSETTDEHFDRARGLLNAGRYEEAAKEFEVVVKLTPDGSKVGQNARYWVGQSYFRMGQFDKALSTFEKLIEDHPGSAIVPVAQLMVERVQRYRKDHQPTFRKIRIPMMCSHQAPRSR